MANKNFMAVYPWMMNYRGELTTEELVVFANIWGWLEWRNVPLKLFYPTAVKVGAGYINIEEEEFILALNNLQEKEFIEMTVENDYLYIRPTKGTEYLSFNRSPVEISPKITLAVR